jgi:hypothetical protein
MYTICVLILAIVLTIAGTVGLVVSWLILAVVRTLPLVIGMAVAIFLVLGLNYVVEFGFSYFR